MLETLLGAGRVAWCFPARDHMHTHWLYSLSTIDFQQRRVVRLGLEHAAIIPCVRHGSAAGAGRDGPPDAGLVRRCCGGPSDGQGRAPVCHLCGPASGRRMLCFLLHSWGLPVKPGPRQAQTEGGFRLTIVACS